MSRMLFVNLAVSDLEQSVAFFGGLGFSFDPRFTDDSATCMVVGEDAFVMLLVRSRFAEFTTKPLVDAATHTEAIMALSAESREEVDALADRALATGGSPAGEPLELGFMYGRSFHDPDGHLWEVVWMDPAAAEIGPAAAEAAAVES
jgi:predicted lactoylglutathione lyase